MARIRCIKPEFFFSESLKQCSRDARLFFIGLWTLADREGRLQWSAGKVKAQVFPYDDDIKIHELAEELVRVGCLTIYEVDAKAYAWIPEFKKHQRPHVREAESSVPPCPHTGVCTVTWKAEGIAKAVPSTGDIPPGTAGREGKGMDKGKGTPPAADPPPPPTLVKKLKPYNEHEGKRLEVPRMWHEAHVKMLGGADADARLRAWYDTLDAQLASSPMPVRSWFKWLDKCYQSWAPDLDADDAAFERRGNAAFDEIDARIAAFGGSK
jgi:hypothetical protein